MTLPLFPIDQDPGPNFSLLLEKAGFKTSITSTGSKDAFADVPHGTTVVAILYSDGVVMAGDRRATAGYSISHRRVEKVHPADSFSGVAISGAAGPAMELVRLFQTQLQHYEKVEGSKLSLEGKANQLSNLVKSNLYMAMQGLAVVPLFAGYDLALQRGRIYTYDITGGFYEEIDYQTTGSGGRDARTTIKLGYRPEMDRSNVIDLAIRALFEAADEDSATGGPDIARRIYPTLATITKDGYEAVDEAEIADRFESIVAQVSNLDLRPSGTPRSSKTQSVSKKQTTKSLPKARKSTSED